MKLLSPKEKYTEMLTQYNDNMINKALGILQNISANEKMQELARMREKALHDEASYLFTAREEGRMEGRMEGFKEGRMEERNKIAEDLRGFGVDDDIIKQLLDKRNKDSDL